MIARLRVIAILACVLPVTLVLAPLQWASVMWYPALAKKIPMYWHKMVLWLVGARVTVVGEIPTVRPLLIVSNHLSWSDILVMGSVMELCFIAKDEVKSIQGVNMLAWLQRSVFVDRSRRRQSHLQADTIAARLLAGDAMVLFAEGTTGSGHRVFPFKSALFGAAQYALKQSERDEVLVQPVAIAYTHLFGMPLGRYHQTQASWPGTIPLGPHLMNFLRKGAYDIKVSFGDPIPISATSNRRQIATQTFESVNQMFFDAMWR